MEDIRRKIHLSGDEVKRLNFIKDSDRYLFRKYYRSGLRSHIFEVLLVRDVDAESCGRIEDGIRIFPRARPVKMFRIFRNRFETKEEIFNEIKRYKLLMSFLGPGFIARSEEFIADYRQGGQSRILLCGLQEYVEGQILDPWRISGKKTIPSLLSAMAHDTSIEERTQRALGRISVFIRRVRKLMDETGYIPDLAGVGNLILTPEGGIKLVDINNIVKIHRDNYIHLDDKGYPACDVSIQVLAILEQEILGRNKTREDPLFRLFLTPGRTGQVKAIEKAFYRQLNALMG